MSARTLIPHTLKLETTSIKARMAARSNDFVVGPIKTEFVEKNQLEMDLSVSSNQTTKLSYSSYEISALSESSPEE
jgi:hypothetical protein